MNSQKWSGKRKPRFLNKAKKPMWKLKNVKLFRKKWRRRSQFVKKN